jgi:threonine/homoserine/homoserine lactone efflux protein
MPAPATLLVFAVAASVLVAIPGPNHLYIVTRSIAQGRRIGLASALGVETGTLVHVSAATVGLSALVASSAMAFNALRFAGAAYSSTSAYAPCCAMRRRPSTAAGRSRRRPAAPTSTACS